MDEVAPVAAGVAVEERAERGRPRGASGGPDRPCADRVLARARDDHEDRGGERGDGEEVTDAEGDEREYRDGRDDERAGEAPLEQSGAGLPPREDRADADEQQHDHQQWPGHIVVEGRPDGNAYVPEQLREDREERPSEDDKRDGNHDVGVQDQPGLPRDERLELIGRVHPGQTPRHQDDRHDDDEPQQDEEERAHL